MKGIWQPVKVLSVKENNGKAILQVAVNSPKEEILKFVNGNKLTGELKLDDKRLISADQRRKIFATIKDISLYTGYEPEYLRDMLQFMYCAENNIEHLSLSNCSLEIAREFVTYLIDFCIDNGIPLSESAIERTDDINSYLYSCIKRKVCCICGSQGIVYTLDNHKNKMCLCNLHYDEAKLKGLDKFGKLYKVFGIKIKEE